MYSDTTQENSSASGVYALVKSVFNREPDIRGSLPVSFFSGPRVAVTDSPLRNRLFFSTLIYAVARRVLMTTQSIGRRRNVLPVRTLNPVRYEKIRHLQPS